MAKAAESVFDRAMRLMAEDIAKERAKFFTQLPPLRIKKPQLRQEPSNLEMRMFGRYVDKIVATPAPMIADFDDTPTLVIAESPAVEGCDCVACKAVRAAPNVIREEAAKLADPLARVVDGKSVGEMLDIYAALREDRPLKYFTPAQREALSAEWSRQLREKQAAAREIERNRVVVDTWDD